MMTTDTRLVGQSVPRREDERLLRGRGAFVEDIFYSWDSVGIARAQPPRPRSHPGH